MLARARRATRSYQQPSGRLLRRRRRTRSAARSRASSPHKAAAGIRRAPRRAPPRAPPPSGRRRWPWRSAQTSRSACRRGVVAGSLQQPRRMEALRRRRGVGEDDDRRLQPLGAVHRHHPHLVARHFHVALHLGLRRAQPRDEALQRRRLGALVVEREIEKFVERVVGLVAEPRQELLAAAARRRAGRRRTRTASARAPVRAARRAAPR